MERRPRDLIAAFPERGRARRHLAVMFGLGALLLALALAHTATPVSSQHTGVHDLLEVVLLGAPAVGVLAIAARATTAPVDDDLYPTLTYWTVGTAVLLVVVGWLLLFYFDVPFWDHDALFAYHFWVALGAFGGAFIGLHEARTVSRAREVALTAEQRDRLEHLNRLLRHDLLNSLMVIRANADLAAEDADGGVRERLETVRRQSARATELIRNVRVLVRASREDRALEPVDLVAVVEEEVDGVRDAHPEATLVADLPESAPVRADPLLGSVVENLLRNAVEHNDREHPTVDVAVEPGETTVALTVTDDGPGIPPEVQETLFSPSEEGDHGFGLYLVETLVERYDGRVTVAETGPDGTTMRVELQRA